MYHGSCTVLDYKKVMAVGGFTPHITEDAELSVRLYLNGYRGLHIKDWKEYGQNLPGNLNMALRTYTRWIYGTQIVLLKYFKDILRSKKLKLRDKLSFIHMFSHFFTFIFVLLFLAIGYLYTFVLEYPPVPQWISNLFITLPLFLLTLQFIVLIISQKRIYKTSNPLVVLLSIVFSWGLSVIAIYSLFKNIFNISENWIVTVKLKKPHRIYKDIQLLYLVFLILSFIYFLFNLPSIAFTTFSIWLASLIFYVIFQLYHSVRI